MGEWRIVSLGALGADRPGAFSTGPFGSAVSAKNFVEAGVPMIRGGNLSDDVGVRLDESEFVFVSEDLASSFSRSIAVAGDLVFTCWGTVGQIGMIDDSARYQRYIVSNKQMKMTPDPRVVSSHYLYYFLSQHSMVSLVRDQAIGSSVPGFNLGQLKGLPVALPTMGEQRAIAEVLGALDDKIVANARVVRLAVSLADAEFARANSDVLTDPVMFDEVTEIGGGGTPKTSVSDYWNGGVCWATPTDVTGLEAPYLSRTSRMITEDGLVACSSRLYPAGSILMTSRATIGAFAVAQMPLAVNQGFIVVNARNRIQQWWLFHEMRARVDEFLSHANGATFLELPRGRFRKLELRMPSFEQARAFASKVGPIHGMAAQLMTETEMLAATREELLPLLMSGRIRVRDAEKVVEEVT